MPTNGSLDSVCRRLTVLWGCEVMGIRSQRRTLGLQIKSVNQVIVRAPENMPDEEILHWTLQRERWVLNHLNRLRNARTVPSVEPGEGWVWIGGEPVVVRWEHRAPHWQHGIHLYDQRGLLMLRGSFSESGMEKLIKSLLEQKLKEAIQRLLEEAVSLLQGHLGKAWSPPTLCFQIRSMRTRWGSCSRHGGIRFSSTLVHVPPNCLRYVVFHEATHWVHFHHGPSFYDLLAKLMPEHKTTASQLGTLGWLWEEGIKLPVVSIPLQGR